MNNSPLHPSGLAAIITDATIGKARQTIEISNLKILFLYPAYESLAIESLSAMLNHNGYRAKLLFDPCLFDDDFMFVPGINRVFSHRTRILDEVSWRRPDIVAFSIVSDRFSWALDLAAAIKSRIETTIVAGGIHVTGAPEKVMAHPAFDFGIRGEADRVIVPLVRSIEAGRPDLTLSNLVYRKNGNVIKNPLAPLIQNLDELPLTDKTIFKRDTGYTPQDMYTIMASRGCPFACSFCNNSLIKSLYPGQKPVRFRSVKNVIAELEEAKKRYKPKVINFLDEVFAAKMSWLEEFVPAYKEKINIPFIACTHPAVESQKRVKLLAEAGCKKVDMGVQTFSERLRKNVVNRPESTEQVANAITWYAKENISLFAENILGFPTETEEDVQKMVAFYNRKHPATIKIFWLSYYPGTKIRQIAKDHGLLGTNGTEEQRSRSITQGGHRTDRRTKQLYLLLQLLPLLPANLVDRILEKKWYRYFPTLIVERFAYLIGRLINRRDPIAEVFMHRYKKHYRHYLVSYLKSFIRP